MGNKLRKDLKRGYINTIAKARLNLEYAHEIEKNTKIIEETQKKIDLLRKEEKEKKMALAELKEEVEKLDTEGIFKTNSMNDFDSGLFDLYDSYSFNGGRFTLADDYYYFWDGDMISIRESELYDFYESALDELTNGEYGREKEKGGRK